MMRKNLLLICSGMGKYKYHTTSKIALSYCRRQFSCSIITFLLLGQIFAYGQEAKALKNEIAGEFAGWDVKVPLGNYYFVKGAISVFGTRWGGEPQTEQELEDRIWEQLLLSYEAHKRNIKVEQKEVDEEISKMLNGEKVAFDWQKDKDAYGEWVKQRTNETVELFENQLRHLIQLENLRKQLLDSFKPTVRKKKPIRNSLMNITPWNWNWYSSTI